MDSTLEQARIFFQDGVADYEAGRLLQAEQKFAAALSLAPGRPSVLTNLGAVRLKLGKREEALALLQEALAQEPDNVDALGHSAAALAEMGVPTEALSLFNRALALDPQRALLWTLRGSLLRELGRLDEAAESFQHALDRGGDAELNRYYLAGVARQPLPPAPPRAYVETLFDRYADSFDSHVAQALQYQAPRLLTQRLAASGRRYRHALDLGCGTGLCGPFLKQLAPQVTGVDISIPMLDKAQALGVYETLVQADAVEYLAAAQEPFDLVIAADVFIYVGVLDEVFLQVGRVLPAQGSFCFTVEESRDQEVVLHPSLRYGHSEAYLRRLAQAHGLRVTALERGPLRQDQRQPIPGLYAWMEKI